MSLNLLILLMIIIIISKQISVCIGLSLLIIDPTHAIKDKVKL